MLNNTIEATIIGSNNEVIKVVTKEKSNDKSLSSTLKLVQTEINEFLTTLVNETDKRIEEIEGTESSCDESEDDTTEKQEEIRISGIKRGEQNIKSSKKFKKT